MTSLPETPPVPKPRTRYSRSSFSSAPSASDREEKEPLRARTETWTGPWSKTKDETRPHEVSLGGVSDLIAARIPSLAGFAVSIKDSAPSAPQAPSALAPPPSAPPTSELANSIAANIPNLATEANAVANPDTNAPLDVYSLAGFINSVTNVNTPKATPPIEKKTLPSPGTLTPGFTDVGALSSLVKSVLHPERSEVTATDEVSTQAKVEYLTMLSHWTSQEELEAESSNEEEEPVVVVPSPGRPTPSRPPPPPPRPPNQSQKPKKPRTATLRVSRKRGSGGSGPVAKSPSVSRSSWLDVWKGFRHQVVWATFDGQVMALWKKRTDHFSELMFHISNITNIKKQDKGRFSIYFRKKHYDFMAHSNDVQEEWVSSLLLARGCPTPAPPKHHGPITLKEPRSRAYGAVFDSELWVFPNKDSFALGVASFNVPLNVASVKSSGKHTFSLITPFKTFITSIDSSKEMGVWMDTLSSCINSSLGSSQIARQLWDKNPSTKLCADCSAPNPEWASVNLLLVLCHTCAGVHRSLGNVSKIRSLTMDNKVWSVALIQLFVSYGNHTANQIWAPVVPAMEQLSPDSSDEERSKFIHDKYSRGRYRRLHALSSSQDLMDQRLREVVCTDDLEEALSLICSGAKVTQMDLLSPAPIHLAERAGESLQVELLRLNEFTEVPPPHPIMATDSAPSVEEEELHGKLEDDRFLFSLENDSAACDVLDLKEVHSVFLENGDSPQFQVQTLNGTLICAADSEEDLLSHFHQILKVILPAGVSETEVNGASAVSRVCVVEMGVSSSQSDAWILLWVGGVSLYQKQNHIHLHPIIRHEMDSSENTVTLDTRDRNISFRFEDDLSCTSWFNHLSSAINNQQTNQCTVDYPGNSLSIGPFPSTDQMKGPRNNQSGGLYPVKSVKGKVPASIERCISHVTHHGLKVEGVYRRCGLATKVNRLVEALMRSPGSAPLESDEQGVLDAAAALKRIVRQMTELVPERSTGQWIQAAVISDERSRFSAYKQLLRKLPDDNRATLCAVFGHFYTIQLFSQVNRMSAQNLALVLVPTLFQTLNQDLVRLLREFIIHHTLLFLGGDEDEITFL